jgi:two-component system chemotaxis response regulator CheB
MLNSQPTFTGRPASVHATELVVIGASAGAIEALSELLPGLAAGLRVPVVIVVHLPPGRASVLPQLFRERCAVPVCEPLDKQPVAAGTIWFAPADYHLMIEADRTFALSVDPPVRFSRPSVDVLFESAADSYGAASAAVVLSGASDDGAHGARMIREAGGFVLVQDPEQALVRAMPETTIARANPQFVGRIADMAATLRNLTGASP